MKHYIVIATVLIAALLVSCDRDAPKDAGSASLPAREVSNTPPKIELHVASTSYDSKTGHLTLVDVGEVGVYNASGEKAQTITHSELATWSAAPSKARAPSQDMGPLTVSGTIDGEPYQHEVELVGFDSTTKTITLKVADNQGNTVRNHDKPSLVALGRFPMHIVCCDCDWKCSIPWVLVGYCGKCVSGVVGASSCCQVCRLPAAPGGTCP